MKSLMTSLICIFCAVCSMNFTGATEIPAQQVVLFGVVDGSQAYFTAMKDPLQKIGGAHMWSAGLLDGKINNRYFLPVSISPGYEYRWKMDHNAYWAVKVWRMQSTQYATDMVRALPDGLKKYDMDERIKNRPSKPPVDKDKAFQEAVREGGKDYSAVKFGIPGPLTDALCAADYAQKSPVHFDILPVSDDTVSLFIYPASPLIEVWQYTGRLHETYGLYVGEWKQVEKFNVSFSKPFRVFSKGSTYFLVTDSGSVYAARKNGEGRDVQMLWDEGNDPVQVVIQNINNRKTYAFTSDTCFELDDELKTKKYENTKEMKEAKDNLERVRVYGKMCK